ncbi:hypothetical protein D3C72_1781170 [compost metagenome]
MYIVGLAEIEQLGFGRDRVGDHRHAAVAGEQAGGAPVDVDDFAFGAVDADRVTDLIGAGGVEDDPGKHIAERALQCQTDNDCHHPGRRQQAFDRQLQYIRGGGNNRDQEDHGTQHILQQSSGMAAT